MYGGGPPQAISFGEQNGNVFNLDLTQLAPNADLEVPTAVNNSGMVVGDRLTFPSAVPSQGFIYSNGSIKFVGGSQTAMGPTTFVDVNNRGVILGDGAVGYNAYTYDNGAITPIEFRAASSANAITANALNNSGEIVGSYVDAKGKEHGFIDNGGRITSVDAKGGMSSDLVSINDLGVALGQSTDKSGHTFAFIYADGKLAPLSVTGAVNTIPVEINNSNQVIGTYTDSLGATHAFIGIPPASSSIADFVAGASLATPDSTKLTIPTSFSGGSIRQPTCRV